MKYITPIFLETEQELNDIIEKHKDTAGEGLSLAFSREWSEQYRKSPQISIKAMKDIATHLPRITQLSPNFGLIPEEALESLGTLKHLKSLSLYWSVLMRDSKPFFKYFPESLVSLDLSRTLACRINGPEELKKLLERLPNLKRLNLAETDLQQFPRLSAPNAKLKSLELFHHTIYEHNRHLTGRDLENIVFNFPNLERLNIICCDGILISDPVTKKAIESLASREGFILSADSPIYEYFSYCKSVNYLKSTGGLSDLELQTMMEQHPQWVSLLSSARSLVDNHHYTLQQLMELLAENEALFKKLIHSKAFHFVEKGIISFAELRQFHGLYGEDIDKLFNAQTSYLFLKNHLTVQKLLELYKKHNKAVFSLLSHDTSILINENGLAFNLILKLFEFAPALLTIMNQFSHRYDNPAEQMAAVIDMLTQPSSDVTTYKRLEKPNTSLTRLKLYFLSKEFPLGAKGLENVLLNFPNLKELILNDRICNFQVSPEERDRLIILFEEYLRVNPDFKLFNADHTVLAVFYEAQAMAFYSQNKGISHAGLTVERRSNPELFSELALPRVRQFSDLVGYSFADMVALFHHPEQFRKLTSYDVQTVLENKWMSFSEICLCFDKNPEKFKALMDYSVAKLVNEHYVTWDEINRIFDKNPQTVTELESLCYSVSYDPDAKVKIEQLKNKVLSEGYENEAAKAETESTAITPEVIANALRMGIFANTKVAFTPNQARLAAEFYYELIESRLIDKLYKDFKYSDGSPTILDGKKKEVFINTLEASLWKVLSTDLSFSVKGQSPLCIGWKHPLVTQALQKAGIALDNNKDLIILVYIGHYENTTYCLGSDVGDCEDFLSKSNASRPKATDAVETTSTSTLVPHEMDGEVPEDGKAVIYV